MKISEIVSLIKVLSNTKNDLSSNDKKSLASKIKRDYRLAVQEIKYKRGSVRLSDLSNLSQVIMNNYENLKEFVSINEIMQEVVEEFKISNENESNDKKIDVEKEIEKIHTNILGNPGTNTKGMSSEYISKIIRRKLTEKDGINREDILNVLNMQSKNMYLDIEGYQKLINDSVIAYLTSNQNGVRFSNPKIFEIFESLAASYKVQEDFDKVREIYEQALGIKSMKNTFEYNEIKEKYNTFMEFLEMKGDFEDRRFDSFEELIESLDATFTNDEIFRKGQQKTIKSKTKESIGPRSNYIMPTKKKLESFSRLVSALKKDNPEYDIVGCELGRDKYNGYVIFKIKGTNVSIFENFNEVNAKLFIVKNEVIDSVKKLAKNEAIDLPGVKTANHIENFENYCQNMISRTRQLIYETQPEAKKKDTEEILFDAKLGENNTGDIIDLPISGEKETEESPDKLELERLKALANREKLKKLQQRLEIIDRTTKEKLKKAHNSYDAPEN